MVTPVPTGSSGPADDLSLKVTPPRVPRDLVTRPRLLASDNHYRDQPVILVQAPAGFGKTSLLAQWRLEHLAQGSVVAWVSAQAQDERQRFVQALAMAVRIGAGRPTFGHTLLEVTVPPGLEGVTRWLAELAQSALDVVLIVDEADHLPTDSRDALVYLLRNAPPNLRVIVAARADCHLDVDDLVDYGQCVVVGPAVLRLQLEETLDLVRKRFDDRLDNDTAARLHDMSEGWPLGLQVAMSAIASGGDPTTGFSTLSAQDDTTRNHFVGLMLANLDATDVSFLTRISILEHLHPDLCRALVESDEAVPRLAHLARDTPVFVAGEGSDWLRMHTLARETLRTRFAALPATEQAALHARASDWLAAHEFVELASRHALASGERDKAFDLAERGLYDSFMARGRQGAVLEWLRHLPTGEMDRRPRLLLAAAWTLALSERHEEAKALVASIISQPDADEALRCECALILGGAAVFADDPDRFAALHDPWSQSPPLRDPLLLQVHANRSAFRTLLEGQPALARLRQQQAHIDDQGPALAYVGRWGDFVIGLTYLWEGQVLLATKLLRPAMARAEFDLGRRSPFTCMLASLLAAALWECDQPDEAAALLANRLDVLERSGLPESTLLGFRTMARIAGARGTEHRALELLGAMDAVGVARLLPRLRIASLADQVRLHARRFRSETCRDLCAQIDAHIADPANPQGRLWQRSVMLLREVAHGHAAIAAQDWRGASLPLANAESLARDQQLGRLHIELLGLRAFVLDRCGENSLGLLREAVDLAQSLGLQRVFADAHPALGDWARQVLNDTTETGVSRQGPLAAPMRVPQLPVAQASARSTPSMALTPKEREVLVLLARNLSNKEIGLAMQVGEETIKWHVKNLFAKLDAGTRKQVVARARILGLIETV